MVYEISWASYELWPGAMKLVETVNLWLAWSYETEIDQSLEIDSATNSEFIAANRKLVG